MRQALLLGGSCDGDIISLDSLQPEISVRRYLASDQVATSPSGEPVMLHRYASAQRYRLCPLGPEMPVYAVLRG
jgi:hypothetical protein